MHGGEIIAAGTIDDIIAAPRSITGQYLSGAKKIPLPEKRRAGNGKSLKIFGAAENNLRHIDVEFPLGTFTCEMCIRDRFFSGAKHGKLYPRAGRTRQ